MHKDPIINSITTTHDEDGSIKIVINFGKNPIRGGIPPSERISKLIIIVVFESSWILFNWVSLIVFRLLKIIKIGAISKVYNMKYVIECNGKFNAISLIIHPMWVIDEYAIIVRSCDWLIPITPPTKAFIAASGSKMCLLVNNINLIMAKGASFCHVDRISAEVHEMEDITDVYQKWHGNAPIFINKENARIMYIDIYNEL